LAALIEAPGVDWSKVEMFHLDEYVGLPITHPASFRKYLLGAARAADRDFAGTLA
jgi:glucosamine-6-phosphate deaminase